MAKIIKNSHWEVIQEYRREFIRIDDPGAGFSFSVIDGKPVFLCDAAERNYLYAQEHPEIYRDLGVIPVRHTTWINSEAICECGRKIELVGNYMGASECPYCGRWHNLFGQELNPPRLWAE